MGGRKRLTLSFDNGPFPDVTPGVLDDLASVGAKATFFVCGKDACGAQRRAILARARSEGHRIGNHTQTHTVERAQRADVEIVEDFPPACVPIRRGQLVLPLDGLVASSTLPA